MNPDLFSVSDDDKAQGMAAVEDIRRSKGRDLTQNEVEDILIGNRLITVMGRLVKAGALPASEAGVMLAELHERFRFIRKMKAEVARNTAAECFNSPYLRAVAQAALNLLDEAINISAPRKIMQLRGDLYSAIFSEAKSPYLELFLCMAKDIDAALFLLVTDTPYSFHPEVEFLKKDLTSRFERQTVH